MYNRNVIKGLQRSPGQKTHLEAKARLPGSREGDWLDREVRRAGEVLRAIAPLSSPIIGVLPGSDFQGINPEH